MFKTKFLWTIVFIVLLVFNFLDANSYSNTISDAYKNKKSDVQIQGEGKVIKILSDDNDGAKHQRFIIKTSKDITVLVAHNIDLAPRIDNLKVGDTVEFYGEYEWNNKGGVMHWTHHDPRQSHVDGWLKHQEKIYQ